MSGTAIAEEGAVARGAGQSDWPVAPDVERGGVRIATELRASVYRWTVTNLGSSPIVSFEVDHYKGYNFIVPEGWSQIDDPELTYFRAWTDDPRWAIGSGESAVFYHRASSSGSDIGTVEVRMRRASGEDVVVGEVWGTVAGPTSAVVTVAGVLCVLVFGHAWIMGVRERRRAVSG
jgi:hypothetical protein